MKDELKSYDAGQVLQASFDKENFCLKVRNLIDEYDYLQVTYPDSKTESYIFKKGGEEGQVIAIITVIYKDSAKENIDKVIKV